MLDKKKFPVFLLTMGEIYDKQLSTNLINIYYEILKNYSIENIEKVCKEIISIHKYNTLPKPAEILEHLEGSDDDRALYAWHSFLKTLREHSYYDSIEFEDKTIHAVIESMGGWLKLSDLEIDKTPFVMQDFIKRYKLFRSKKMPSVEKKLIGYYELNNTGKGDRYAKYIPKIIFVKDEYKPNEFKKMEWKGN